MHLLVVLRKIFHLAANFFNVSIGAISSKVEKSNAKTVTHTHFAESKHFFDIRLTCLLPVVFITLFVFYLTFNGLHRKRES